MAEQFVWNRHSLIPRCPASGKKPTTKSAKLNQNGLESTKLKTTFVASSTPHLHSPLRKHLAGRSQASGAEARASDEPSHLPCKRSESL
jgi:hypothetical protein